MKARTLGNSLAYATLLAHALTFSVWAVDYTSTGTGPWATATNWSPEGVPLGASDSISILGSHRIDMEVSTSIGDVTVNSGGTLGLGSTVNANRTLDVAGNFTNYGTVLAASSSPQHSIRFNGDHSVAGQSDWTGSGDISGAKARVLVNGGSVLNLSGLTTPLKFRNSGTIQSSVTGTLITGTQVINGNGNASCSFAFNSGSTLVSANPNGLINGSIGTFNFAGAVTFNAATSFTFNGIVPQVTLGMPASVSNLTCNNASGVNLSNPTTVNGTLQLRGKPIGLEVTAGAPSLTAATLASGGPGARLDITSLPPGVVVNDSYTLISFTSLVGELSDFSLGTMPPGYTGHLVTAGGGISLVIDTAPRALIWSGSPDGNWNTVSQNWFSGSATNYNQGDLVTFDDSASGTTNINLTVPLNPGSLKIDNTDKAYVFSGTGSIGGDTGLVKEGTNSLTLSNSGTDTFTGGIALNGGSLVFDRSGASTVSQVISGAGALTQAGPGTLTLSAANSHAGGNTVNGGTLRLGTTTAAGTGPVLVNNPASLVVGGTSLSNAITLANGKLGGSGGTTTLSGPLTLPAGTTSTVYTTDPQDLTKLANFIHTGTISGSGNINIVAGTGSSNPDSTTGAFRLNSGTDAGYSGTITVGNLVKAEIQSSVQGEFTPIGTGKIVLVCGTNDAGALTGSYSNLLLRNNSGGGAVFGNDLELSGVGLAVVNPLGSAPAGSFTTMGTLKIGNGQNLGAYRSGGNLHTVVFPNVILTGGTATLSPKPSGFLSTVVGSDISVGNVSETVAGSNLVIDGMRTLFITGHANHTGTTTVANGSLGGTGTITGSVIVQGTGTLAPGASGLTGTLSTGPTSLGGSLRMDVADDDSDLLAVTGTLNLSSGLVTIVGEPTAESYTLATASAISGVPTLQPAVPGYTLVVEGNSLKLVEQSPFESWAKQNSLTGDDALPAADPDNDGMVNSLEFVLGGNPRASDAALVAVAANATSITLSFTRSDASELQPITLSAQVSDDPDTWNPANDIIIGAADGSGPNGATYTVAENAGDPDSIVVSIPMNGASRKFVRLKAVMP
jgi:autotransporter-associated beta strand protein